MQFLKGTYFLCKVKMTTRIKDRLLYDMDEIILTFNSHYIFLVNIFGCPIYSLFYGSRKPVTH